MGDNYASDMVLIGIWALLKEHATPDNIDDILARMLQIIGGSLTVISADRETCAQFVINNILKGEDIANSVYGGMN